MKENKKFNTMNKDTILLDTPVKPEYDTERVLKHEHDKVDFKSINKDIMRLDTVVKPEYDKTETFPLSPSDNDTSSLSFPCLTRESRSHECRIETGRSMVEMLGVLAVIGVLSIGGIMGYSYGMDKYRANETINDINLRGIDLVRQVSMGQAPSLTEWETKSTAGYTFSNAQLSAEGDAYFTVSGVPKRVCEIIYEGIQNNQTTDVEVNEATNGDASDCHKDDDNIMGFFFITNAGEGGSLDELCKDVTCKEGYSCTHGICMSEEVPGFSTGVVGCKTDNACGECQYCADSRYCTSKDNGIECDGGTCQDGYCVSVKNICTEHSDCEQGFFCDVDFSPSQCVKFEFSKIYLSEINENIYISKRDRGFHGLREIDPNLFCELNGFSLIAQEYFLSEEFLNAFSLHTSAGIPFLTQGGRCHNDGECWEDFDYGYAICIDK